MGITLPSALANLYGLPLGEQSWILLAAMRSLSCALAWLAFARQLEIAAKLGRRRSTPLVLAASFIWGITMLWALLQSSYSHPPLTPGVMLAQIAAILWFWGAARVRWRTK